MGLFSNFFGAISPFSAVKDIIGIGGGLFDTFGDPPEQQFKTRPPFRGTIVTPAFNFGGGVLSRTGTDVFSSQDFATRLGNVRTVLTGHLTAQALRQSAALKDAAHRISVPRSAACCWHSPRVQCPRYPGQRCNPAFLNLFDNRQDVLGV